MYRPHSIHWVLICSVPVLTTACHWTELDTRFGWPFVWALDEWDVSNPTLPFDYFRVLPLACDIAIGALVGYVLAEAATRMIQFGSKK